MRRLIFGARVVVAVAAAASTLSAAILTTAARADWSVAGEEFSEKSSATLVTAAKVSTPLLLSVPGQKVKISCKGSLLKAESPSISGVDALEAKSLTYEGCETIEPATKCALQSQPTSIATKPLKALTAIPESLSPPEGQLTPEARLSLKPQSGSVLASIAFSSSNTCAYNGTELLTGSVQLGMPKAAEELAEQPIEGLGTTENTSLELAKEKANLQGGKAALKLASGKAFNLALNVSVLNAGGVVGVNTNTCLFSLKLETCTIEVINSEAFGVLIDRNIISGTNASARYGRPGTMGCKRGTLVAMSGGTCTEMVKLLLEREEATEPLWVNDYYLSLIASNDPNNVGFGLVNLRR